MCPIIKAWGSCQLNLFLSWVLLPSLVHHQKERKHSIILTCRWFGVLGCITKMDTKDQLTRKWTSNHPPKPQNLVFSRVIDDEMFDLTFRMSSTVAVKQSISFTKAAVPITWCGWRLFHDEVCRNLMSYILKSTKKNYILLRQRWALLRCHAASPSINSDMIYTVQIR